MFDEDYHSSSPYDDNGCQIHRQQSDEDISTYIKPTAGAINVSIRLLMMTEDSRSTALDNEFNIKRPASAHWKQ